MASGCRLLAIEKLHTLEAGVFEKIMTAVLKLAQCLQELPGEIPKSDSTAAKFADDCLCHFASDLERVAAAMPYTRLHAAWSKAMVLRLLPRFRGKMKPKLTYMEASDGIFWHWNRSSWPTPLRRQQ